ncbi:MULTISPECIES: ferredoxin [unclassified Mycobacterium]|uniref:ferredoxin n=1 Tax=unclassified Mycobacterium TaxID=2642494 RepID=UPI0029C844AD|nr:MULTISPECIES: ferredoxin [unclassified Mycobacterium]
MSVRADNRLDDAPMVAVECRRCAATVLVRKSSRHQTSIQWSAAAHQACPERQAADMISAHGPRGVFLACAEIKGSIADAVRRGDVSVVDDAVALPTGP